MSTEIYSYLEMCNNLFSNYVLSIGGCYDPATMFLKIASNQSALFLQQTGSNRATQKATTGSPCVVDGLLVFFICSEKRDQHAPI